MHADIEALRASFDKLQTLDPDGPLYQRLCALLDSCTDEALIFAKDSGIRFVSSLALNRCIRRGLIGRVTP